MNKVVKILLIVLFLIAFIFLITSYKFHYLNKENIKLKNSIKTVELDNNVRTKELDELNIKLTKIKEDEQNKWQELKIWEKAKNKLEKVLN